jgi:predicted nucleotidyltransferase
MKTLNPDLLAEVVRRIAKAVNPEKIYLYGSHAYGTPHEDSDVDLLVIIEHSSTPSYTWARPAYGALKGLFFPAEIKVVTKDEFARHLKWVVSIEREASEKGKVVYERPSA